MINSNILIFIIIILIMGILALIFWERKGYNTVPRKIWTYWDEPSKMPKTIQICMETWKKYNPTYEIILLTKKNFKGYVTIPDTIREHPIFNQNESLFSDLLRLWVLAEHGGIWINASTLIKKPLDSWLFPRYAEFSGFYQDTLTQKKEYPVIQSWFMACNKNSNLLKLCRDEFSQIATFPSIDKYVVSRKEMGIDFQNIESPLSQTILISIQKVIQVDKYQLDCIILNKAEDGPIKYLVNANWNSEKALQLACSKKVYQTPIMKLGSSEIKILEERLDLSPNMCGWDN